MIWTIVGWVIWAFVALFTLAQWESKFKNRDGGVRILAGRCAFLFTVALVVTAVTPISKLHLIWACPVLYMGSMMVTGMLMSRNASRAMEGFMGDRVQQAIAEEGTLPGLPGEDGQVEIGRDMPWPAVVRHVFRVIDFDPLETTLGADGRPPPRDVPSFEPYGFLAVESPMLPSDTLLPIVHRDDFFLAATAFHHDDLTSLSDTHELLVSYVPFKLGSKERVAAGGKHCLHYVMCPAGTLEKYYEVNDGLYKREPEPERLFGDLVFDGFVQVKINDTPALR